MRGFGGSLGDGKHCINHITFIIHCLNPHVNSSSFGAVVGFNHVRNVGRIFNNISQRNPTPVEFHVAIGIIVKPDISFFSHKPVGVGDMEDTVIVCCARKCQLFRLDLDFRVSGGRSVHFDFGNLGVMV